jgi:hypothetical protein
VQTFGTYRSLEEATWAYDIGVILLKGATWATNKPKSVYLTPEGHLKPGIVLPARVRASVQHYLAFLYVSNQELFVDEHDRISGVAGKESGFVFEYPSPRAAPGASM